MEITLTISSDSPEDTNNRTITVNTETSLSTLSLLPVFSVYYSINQPCAHCGKLPFIMDSRQKIRWDIPLEKINIADFLRTHVIENNTITANEFKGKILNLHTPSPLDSINKITGELGFNITCHAIYKNIIKETGAAPFSAIEYILSKTSWNPQELADSISYPQNRIEILLKGLGYEFNSKKNLYMIQAEKLNSLKEQLMQLHESMF